MSTQTTPVVDAEKQALLARIAELEAKVERKTKLSNALTLNYGKGKVKVVVSAKGGISFYGFNVRFPLSLYKQALLCILDNAEVLRKFIVDHESELSSKSAE